MKLTKFKKLHGTTNQPCPSKNKFQIKSKDIPSSYDVNIMNFNISLECKKKIFFSRKRNYIAAIEAFNAVFDYTFSYKKDDATLMLGRCYQKLGQRDKAISYFEELIMQYPDSEYVPKAQQWINRIQ